MSLRPDAPAPTFDFGVALVHLKLGKKVTRTGWNGKGQWIAVMPAGAGTGMTLSFIYMKTVTDDTVPWLASQTDMLAEDWVLVH